MRSSWVSSRAWPISATRWCRGNFEVLSTKIFFAVVGAAHDQGRAAVLSIILLGFTLAAFWLQYAWLGKRVYTTVTGKGDAGVPPPLPRRVAWLSYAAALPWAAFTLVVYVIIIVGGFVRSMGRDYTPTLEHFLTGFRIETTPQGLISRAAPGTRSRHPEGGGFRRADHGGGRASHGLSPDATEFRRAAALRVRHHAELRDPRHGRRHELHHRLQRAADRDHRHRGHPRDVFVFRNMPVAVRSGIATLSQIDKSLDEASLTLGARSFATVRRVILPLLRPAVVASLVYSFVRAMTAVSAVIFLVSAEYNLATTYIVGRVEAGELGLPSLIPRS